MIKILALAITIALGACGARETEETSKHTNEPQIELKQAENAFDEPEYQEHYNSFIADAKEFGSDLSKQPVKILDMTDENYEKLVELNDMAREDGFVPARSEIQAVCSGATLGSDNARYILVSNEHWEKLSNLSTFKKAIIYHELAHCLLGRGHNTKYLQTSLMNYEIALYTQHGRNNDQMTDKFLEINWNIVKTELFSK